MSEMMPLLMVALLVWVGLFSFLMGLDARVRALEARIERGNRDGGNDDDDTMPPPSEVV